MRALAAAAAVSLCILTACSGKSKPGSTPTPAAAATTAAAIATTMTAGGVTLGGLTLSPQGGGHPTVRDVLSASATATGPGAIVRYQGNANGAPIPGASGESLPLAA